MEKVIIVRYAEIHLKGKNRGYFERVFALHMRGRGMRFTGSAALDLCYVACGRGELFFEYSLCPWDFAAGALLIEEAGGRVSTMAGTPLRLDRRCSVWASNAENFSLLEELPVERNLL